MATKKIEICTVRMGKHSLDNDYVIYNDGKYERVYDRSAYALNLLERGIVSAFSNHLRDRLVRNCAVENRAALEELFSKHPPAPDS